MSLNKNLLIASCGMNCGICRAFLRLKNSCPGCRAEDNNKPNACINCKIKNCEIFQNGKARFCFECKKIPCDKLKHLDKRYKTRYNMSMIENLRNIKKNGIRKFIKDEEKRWSCSKCGGTISVHNGLCSNCGIKK